MQELRRRALSRRMFSEKLSDAKADVMMRDTLHHRALNTY
jgi:hypothetical protein